MFPYSAQFALLSGGKGKQEFSVEDSKKGQMFAECSFGKAGKWKIVRQSWRMSDSGLESWPVTPWLYGDGVLHIDVIARAGVQSKGALAAWLEVP